MKRSIPNNTWDRILGAIEPRVSSHSFKTWFGPTQYLDEDASSLTISVPNNWFADWIRTHYLGMIQEALRDADRPGLTLCFHSESRGEHETPPAEVVLPGASPATR